MAHSDGQTDPPFHKTAKITGYEIKPSCHQMHDGHHYFYTHQNLFRNLIASEGGINKAFQRCMDAWQCNSQNSHVLFINVIIYIIFTILVRANRIHVQEWIITMIEAC